MLITPAVWLALIILTALMLEGCAMVGLTLLGVGAGVGTNYTLDGIAYRTFTESIDDVRRATLLALKRMDITLERDDVTDTGAFNRFALQPLEDVKLRDARLLDLAVTLDDCHRVPYSNLA